MPALALEQRVKARAERLYFSRAVPSRLREADLDRRMRRVFRTSLAYPDPPVTFREKMRYKMLNDRRPLLTTFADKVAVRDYVEAKVGPEILKELYLVTHDVTQIRRGSLPREFALKPSHGSGASMIVGEHVPRAQRLPQPPVGWARVQVSPESLDWGRLRNICREWFRLRYKPTSEWAYRNVPPSILVEELLVEDGSVPTEFRFFVFRGGVRLITVDLGRFTGNQLVRFYAPDWRPLDVRSTTSYPTGPPLERPVTLAEMTRIAETLGEDTDFVRVDLSDFAGRVVFGELTSYPYGGVDEFRPASFEHELGAWWAPPEVYR